MFLMLNNSDLIDNIAMNLYKFIQYLYIYVATKELYPGIILKHPYF